jgi:hypothetical protein
LICAENRGSRFPFDVQHRSVITYRTDAPQDFANLERKITERLMAIMQKEERLGQLVSPIADVEGLSQHEMVALVSVAENLESPPASVSAHQIRQDMERVGFARVATFLSLAALVRKGLVTDEADTDYSGDVFMIYRLTAKGVDWLMKNQDKLVLREEPRPALNPFASTDDDIPF